MYADFIQNKRDKLSRSYQLITEYNYLRSGYMSKDKLPTKIEYFSKWMEYQLLAHYFGAVPLWRRLARKFSGKRTLPDFCIVGPIKSGTSDLAVNILLHPNVMLPLAKEYYTADIEKWRTLYPTEKQKKNYALHTSNGLAVSPFLAPYLHWMELVFNLSKIRPNTKVVITLRNPVERFYSHWKWEVFLAGRERATDLPFLNSFPAYVDKALSVFPEFPMFTACNSEPLQTSIYWKAVSYWIERFGQDNLLVLDVQDYFLDSNGFLNQIYDFVGLPPFNVPEFENRVNENPIILPPPDEESITKLRAFFEPHNQKLWCLLGKEFDWR